MWFLWHFVASVNVYELTEPSVFVTHTSFNVWGILPQLLSSDLSPQSSLKSHTWLRSTHTLLLHVNIFAGHKGCGSGNKIEITCVNVNQLSKRDSSNQKLEAYQAGCNWRSVYHRWQRAQACWRSWRLRTGCWSAEGSDQPLPHHDAINLHGSLTAIAEEWTLSSPSATPSALQRL